MSQYKLFGFGIKWNMYTLPFFACLAWSALAFLPCQGSRMWLAGNTFVLMESSLWASLEKAGSLRRDGL